ncbi:M23 family metallopeptidase [Agromyces sp. S2-1-8]|uniref:M23 family metallopeptidase n=1 Tax=Agromyces sp. S2-1-8 TaxID=2897180 RepID=UPI001E423979|nr:M23 family metallopeptidase [Agromyces sp. S2-1-8]MCD5345647.1 M23 family metallopeptidase [Agromyces sp. S2-1-8]
MPPVDLRYPFEGRWLTQHSPADRVPSHGTAEFATSYAIDFVPVGADGRSGAITLASLVRPEPAERFPGFARPILSPVAGVVVATHDAEPDHDAYRGVPSIGYALGQRRRASLGWLALAGNHVMIRAEGGIVVLCHLQRASVSVRIGQAVRPGEQVGRCGNSGNSTEPHVHLQVVDRLDVVHARAVPITFGGWLPRNGEVVDADQSVRSSRSRRLTTPPG